jgi:hypothetical protein
MKPSTAREQGQRGCRPFPLHPKSPPNLPPLRCVRADGSWLHSVFDNDWGRADGIRQAVEAVAF